MRSVKQMLMRVICVLKQSIPFLTLTFVSSAPLVLMYQEGWHYPEFETGTSFRHAYDLFLTFKDQGIIECLSAILRNEWAYRNFAPVLVLPFLVLAGGVVKLSTFLFALFFNVLFSVYVLRIFLLRFQLSTAFVASCFIVTIPWRLHTLVVFDSIGPFLTFGVIALFYLLSKERCSNHNINTVGILWGLSAITRPGLFLLCWGPFFVVDSISKIKRTTKLHLSLKPHLFVCCVLLLSLWCAYQFQYFESQLYLFVILVFGLFYLIYILKHPIPVNRVLIVFSMFLVWFSGSLREWWNDYFYAHAFGDRQSIESEISTSFVVFWETISQTGGMPLLLLLLYLFIYFLSKFQNNKKLEKMVVFVQSYFSLILCSIVPIVYLFAKNSFVNRYYMFPTLCLFFLIIFCTSRKRVFGLMSFLLFFLASVNIGICYQFAFPPDQKGYREPNMYIQPWTFGEVTLPGYKEKIGNAYLDKIRSLAEKNLNQGSEFVYFLTCERVDPISVFRILDGNYVNTLNLEKNFRESKSIEFYTLDDSVKLWELEETSALYLIFGWPEGEAYRSRREKLIEKLAKYGVKPIDQISNIRLYDNFKGGREGVFSKIVLFESTSRKFNETQFSCEDFGFKDLI